MFLAGDIQEKVDQRARIQTRRLNLRRLRIGMLFLAALQLQLPQAQSHPVPHELLQPSLGIEHKEAVRLGREAGIGRIRAVSPEPATPLVAAEFAEFIFEYETGRTTIERGGHIRLAMRHVFHWSPPQISNPGGEGYVTVTGPDDVELEILAWPDRADGLDLFLETFPWQHAIDLRVVSGRLAEGDIVTVTYGDMKSGGLGAHIQPSEEEAYAFRFYVMPQSGAASLPLERDVTFEIVGAAADHISMIAQGDTEARLTVRAEDEFGNLDVSFESPVEIRNSEGDVVWNGHMRRADRGLLSVDLERQAPNQSGYYTATASAFGARSNPLSHVSEEGGHKVFWGDLHGHTLASDGRGTIEGFYSYCRDVAALDFCAVTDHGFQITDDSWAESKRVTEAFNETGKFVTIQAYEWSGLTDVGGDHNIFFRTSNPPLFRSRSYYDERNQQAHHGEDGKINFIGELHSKLLAFGARNVMSVPHFGGRAANPEWHEPKIERLVEIFSEHGRKHDWAYGFLQQDYRLGIIASSDNHTGRPGYGFLANPYLPNAGPLEIGTALVGVIADDLNRDAIFDALYDRHVYATTGDRILLSFKAGAALMGDEIVASEMPELHVEVSGVEAVQRVEILRDTEIVHVAEFETLDVTMSWRDPSQLPIGRTAAYWVRIVQVNGEEAISSPIWWTRSSAQQRCGWMCKLRELFNNIEP